MSIARQVGLAAMLALGLAGCRAPGTNSSLGFGPRPTLPKTALVDLDDFVAQHNANADKIQSLVAKPAVTIDARGVRMSEFNAGTEGRLAMERPQNFKLMLELAGQRKVADIGSNDHEFWFWVPNERDRSIYWCNYSDLDKTGAAVPFQPDWIVESMALKPISSEEASHIKAKAGPESGTSTLTFPPTHVGGETYYRTIVVNNRDKRIKEHRILAADNRTVVLEATLTDYKEYDLPETRGAVETCFLADSIRLDWKREKIAFDVKMKDVRVNDLAPSMSVSLFVIPEIPGYERRNIAELKRGSAREQKTTVRRTIPAPDPRQNARLKDPSPASDGEADVPRLGQSMGSTPTVTAASRRASATRTASGGTDALPPLPPLEELVGAPIATVPSATDARTAGIMGSQGGGYGVQR